MEFYRATVEISFSVWIGFMDSVRSWMMHTPKCLEQHKISTTNTKKRQQFSGHSTQQAGNYLPSHGHLAQKYIEQIMEDTSQKKKTTKKYERL